MGVMMRSKRGRMIHDWTKSVTTTMTIINDNTIINHMTVSIAKGTDHGDNTAVVKQEPMMSRHWGQKQ